MRRWSYVHADGACSPGDRPDQREAVGGRTGSRRSHVVGDGLLARGPHGELDHAVDEPDTVRARQPIAVGKEPELASPRLGRADLIEVGHFIVVTSRTAVTACSSTSAGIVGTCLDLVRRRSGCPTHRPGVEGYLASMPVFALWSAPRARSTAFVRSMVERGDLIALHEPFCNLADFGRPISKGGRSVQPRRSSPGCVIRPMTSGCS
jgi:hypothetical protein